MKTTNHTPGPWQFDQSALTGRIDIRKKHANGDSRILGYVWHDQNGESNANLIAAAPDLLSALREMMSVFQDHEQYDEESAEVVSIARAAIAKAEGVA